MKYATKSTNTEFKAIMNRRSSPKTIALCKILKSGKAGKPCEYTLLGSESSAEEVITRLESCNPGQHWVEA